MVKNPVIIVKTETSVETVKLVTHGLLTFGPDEISHCLFVLCSLRLVFNPNIELPANILCLAFVICYVKSRYSLNAQLGNLKIPTLDGVVSPVLQHALFIFLLSLVITILNM